VIVCQLIVHLLVIVQNTKEEKIHEPVCMSFASIV